MRLQLLVRRAEFAHPQPYNGKGEAWVAIAACLLWFGAIVVRLGLSDRAYTPAESFTEATSFIVFAGIPVFFLATPLGDRFARRLLLKQGLEFQVLTCLLLAIYISLVKLLNFSPDNFPVLAHLRSLIFPEQFWMNTALFVGAVFIVLRIPFLLLDLKAFQRSRPSVYSPQFKNSSNLELLLLLLINSIYISLVNTSALNGGFRLEKSNYLVGLGYFLILWIVTLTHSPPPRHRLRLLDFLLFAACLLSLFWFSMPRLNFGVFISLDLFIMVIFYGSNLRREHFGYSFQIRSSDLLSTMGAIAIAFLILVPAALILKFGHSTGIVLPKAPFEQLAFFLSYAVLFSFRVGIFEEILFRSGLMTLIRDLLQQTTRDRLSGRALVLASAVICSLIFGLCHLGNDPGPHSTLAPHTYKLVYAGLATIASLFYALIFGETNRLAGAIVVHGIVDTTAVVGLGAALTVPF